MMKRLIPLFLLLMLMGLPVGAQPIAWQDASQPPLRGVGEPSIRLTSSAGVGTTYSFNIIGDGSNPIQIDWGDGNLVTLSSPMAKGQKAGPEIKVYGECLAFLATGAHITTISIDAPKMGMLSLADNELTTLDLSKTPALETINLQNNKLTSLKVQTLQALTTLNVKSNKLTAIELSGLNALKTLMIADNPDLKTLDVASLVSLKSIRADDCGLEQVTLPAGIEELYAKGSKLTSLGEGALSLAKLKRLRLPNNQIVSLAIGNCPLLNDLELDRNKLTSLSLGEVPALKTLYLQENQMDATALNAVYNKLPTLQGTIKVAGNPGAETASGYIASEKGWTIDVTGKTSSDPDPYIIIKTKPDREVYLGLAGFAETGAVKIELDEGVVVDKEISSGTPPIEKYKSSRGEIKVIGLVHTIDCSENGSIAYEMDTSHNPKLVKLYALHNTMTAVNVKGCSDLTFMVHPRFCVMT